MSYILDALRKSDEKRNALNLPPHRKLRNYPQEAKNHRTLWAVAALLIAAAGGWFLAQSLQINTTALTVSDSKPAHPTVVTETSSLKTGRKAPPVRIVTATPAPELSAESVQTLPAQIPVKAETADSITVKQPSEISDLAMLEHSSIPPSLQTDDHEPAVANEHIPGRSESRSAQAWLNQKIRRKAQCTESSASPRTP